jgi:hypothetical protein
MNHDPSPAAPSPPLTDPDAAIVASARAVLTRYQEWVNAGSPLDYKSAYKLVCDLGLAVDGLLDVIEDLHTGPGAAQPGGGWISGSST